MWIKFKMEIILDGKFEWLFLLLLIGLGGLKVG